jgi:hypothetical protein
VSEEDGVSVDSFDESEKDECRSSLSAVSSNEVVEECKSPTEMRYDDVGTAESVGLVEEDPDACTVVTDSFGTISRSECKMV